MTRRRHPNSVIKPVGMDKDFVLLSREFAQDHSISHFTRSVILDVTSRSEDYVTNVATIMTNFGVGRDKAERVLSEGANAGYIYAHRETDEKGRFCGVTYHISNSKAHLKMFIDAQGFKTHALKNQGVDIHALENQAVDSSHNYRKERTKEEKELKFKAKADALADMGGINQGLEEAVPPTQKTGKASRKRKPYGEGFEAFFTAYRKAANGMQGSKAEAAAEWSKLDSEEQETAAAAIPAYAKQTSGQRLSMKHAVRYLRHRVFDDFGVSASDEHEKQIKAVALDIAQGNLQAAVYSATWWKSLTQVPAIIMDRAKAMASTWEVGQECFA